MRTFRNTVMDAEVLSEFLSRISEYADEALEEAIRYKAQAEEISKEDSDADYYLEQAARQEAKAAAYERLLSKLSK